MSDRPRARTAVLAGTAWLLLPAALVFSAVVDRRLSRAGRDDLLESTSVSIVFVFAAFSASTVGAVLALRRPRHPVGWLFLGLGGAMAVSSVIDSYSAYAGLAVPGRWPHADLVAVVGDASFIPWLVLVALVLQLTPTGRALSPRWAAAARVTVIAGVVGFVGHLLSGHTLNAPYDQVRNPWAVQRAASVIDPIEAVAVMLVGVGLVVGGASLFVRFRRSEGAERRQLWWMALVVVPLPVCVVASFVAAYTNHEGILFVATFGFVALVPVAAGLSISRYHLYDVDRIISRAASWTLLSGLLAGVYTGVVIVAASWVDNAGGDSAIAPVVATLATVSLAAPARRRIQALFDRRFNRRRYDALQMTRRFLRDPTPGMTMEEMVRAALGDPSAHLSYRVEDSDQWVSEDGRLVAPAEHEIEAARHGIPVARLAFDPSRVEREIARELMVEAMPELDNVRLRAALARQLTEVQDSRARIVAAQVAERRRIERNLHDGAQQRLLATAMHLRAAQLSDDTTRVDAAVERAVDEIQCAVQDLRALANGIHPAILGDAGLAAALDDLAGRIPIAVSLATTTERFDPAVEEVAWFIACEAVTNAVKHAGAGQITITASRTDGVLSVAVADDGVGGADARGSGLRGIADRAEAAGGRLTVHTACGTGTTIAAELPCGS